VASEIGWAPWVGLTMGACTAAAPPWRTLNEPMRACGRDRGCLLEARVAASGRHRPRGPPVRSSLLPNFSAKAGLDGECSSWRKDGKGGAGGERGGGRRAKEAKGRQVKRERKTRGKKGTTTPNHIAPASGRRAKVRALLPREKGALGWKPSAACPGSTGANTVNSREGCQPTEVLSRLRTGPGSFGWEKRRGRMTA